MLHRLMRRFLVGHGRALAAVLVLTVGQVVCQLLLPSLNADIINKGILARDTHYIWTTGGEMLVITLVQAGLAVAAVYYASRIAMAVGRDIRGALFHRVTDFSAQDVARFGAPSLITRITNDVSQVQILVLMMGTLFLAAPITIVVGIVMAVREDGPLTLIFLVSVPLVVLVVGSAIARMMPQFEVMQTRIDRINEILREQITGMRVVRAFVREDRETDRFAGANADLTAVSLATGRIMVLIFPTVLIVVNVSSVAAVWIGGNRINGGAMQVGALVAFLSYLIQVLMSVVTASFTATMVPRAAVSAERIEEVLGAETSVRAPADPVTELPGPASVEFRDVSFGYPGAEHEVLSRISFTARAGETVAFIGSTGSGKTTLCNLVPRLFDVTGGSVLVNGVDVRAVDLEVLWSHIGVVPQKPFLFSGTVASNLRHADPGASDDDLWHALRIAQADDFVRAMPDGLDARIAQGGSNVSGGQRQRLAIARALVRRPSIYVFDDSFSALDLATDARLRAALAPEVADAVTLVVAQRVSTILRADRIVVLDDGVVVGIGPHHELMDTCPTYLEIVESQLTREEAA